MVLTLINRISAFTKLFSCQKTQKIISNLLRICDECGDPACCGTRLVMIDVKKAIDPVFESTSLADMVERSAAALKRKQNVVDYSI
jgi:DNA-binding IscR family transcriptional regulator